MSNKNNEKNEIHKDDKKVKNGKKKIIIAIILFLQLVIIGGGCLIFKYIIINNNKTSQIDENTVTNDGGTIIKDYKFESDGTPVAVKPPNIGMAIKSAIQSDTSGSTTMNIKNSGDVAIAPQIIFNGMTIYTSPTLQPGEAVEANLNFGELSIGEHEFNVLAMYQGGSGLSLKSKVIVE